MKFVELKKRLGEKLDNVYLISGSDRYLCFKALEMIELAAHISIKDMNSVTMLGDQIDAKDIVDSASVFPFGDEYRLVVVKNFNPKLSQGSKKNSNEALIDNYINAPSASTILVFFNADGDEFFKNLKSKLVHIDCEKLDISSIVKIIISDANRQGVKISEGAAKLLALYSNLDMTRVTSELSKLISYAISKGEIVEDDVRSLVVEDKEYQIFELSEYLSQGKKLEAMNMIQALTVTGKSGFSILTPLYNNYRRVLFTAINSSMRDADIAAALGVKEYAIKMCRNQARVFTPKKLKKIVDMLTSADKKIKNGTIKEDIAVKTIIIAIMKLREEK